MLLNPEIWVAFLTLLALEIVLGIDNIVFISILVDKLPEERQALARRLGLGLALVMRIILLLSLSWVIGLTAPLFTVLAQEISGRDVILILGGLFLLGKATYEIHENLEGEEGHSSARVKATFASVLVQIILIDMVFSLDSVITAVGMVDQVSVMIAAVTVAIVVMLFSAEAVAGVVSRHPTLKMLALSFLLLIGLVPPPGRLRPARAQGLHLLRDGLLRPRRAAEHPRPAPPRGTLAPRQAASALREVGGGARLPATLSLGLGLYSLALGA
jgi:predicted tellurium resistance membrane protein TerC